MKRYLSKYFNHVLKGAHVLPVFDLVYLIFYRTNTQNVYDYISHGILWPPVVQLELNANMHRSKDHIVVLFNIDNDTFQVQTPHIPGVKKEV